MGCFNGSSPRQTGPYTNLPIQEGILNILTSAFYTGVLVHTNITRREYECDGFEKKYIKANTNFHIKPVVNLNF